MNPVTVILDEYEIQECIEYALLFESESERLGLNNRPGYCGKNSLEDRIFSMFGEQAVSKYLRIPFNPRVNTFKRFSDIPGGIEVRSRKKRWYDLLVRDDDPSHRKYVLVTQGDGMNEFEIHGFLPGEVAKSPKWKKNYGGGYPAYFIPKSNLLPVERIHT